MKQLCKKHVREHYSAKFTPIFLYLAKTRDSMYELIICEKPASAKKVAEALADTKPRKEISGGVAYYELTHDGKKIVVGAAVGHLFGLAEKEKTKGFAYPVFDIEWLPSFVLSKGADYTKKYIDCIKKIAKGATTFTVATDYDTEGEVIGLNIIRYLCNRNDAKRMKFSTLTTQDLQEAYATAAKTLNWGQAEAGETRHYLDYYYGINISRALTKALKTAGLFQLLSTGRVQGPALKIITEREQEIQAFKSVPYWEISMDGIAKNKPIQAWHATDKFWEKKNAEQVFSKTTGNDGTISDIKKTSIKQHPPHPFDLTTLQTEAYRLFGMNPKRTADLAQELYTAGYTSYPRTSSQQLPPALGFVKIMSALSKQKNYKELIAGLLKKKELIPHNGQKTDPAHPAIYPTGATPKLLKEPSAKVYDLIVKRFLATFGEPAMRESVTVRIDVNTEPFLLKGARTTTPGWHTLYAPYVKLEEVELPALVVGDSVKNKKITLYDKETQPPKRYTPASIIKELEKRNLGTKATRADIVETLYERNYVKNESLQATQLGVHIVEVLTRYSPKILDEELTRHFEADLDQIRAQQQKKDAVLVEAREVLTDILKDFKKNEHDIGKGLLDVVKEQRETTSTVGACPVCKQGTLKIRRGKFGMFIACDKYPDCKTTFKLPVAKSQVTKELCETCNYPVILVMKRGARKLCINLDCPTKHENDHLFKPGPCPKCNQGQVILRKSLYGAFAACNKFPACRYALRLGKKESKEKTTKKKE